MIPAEVFSYCAFPAWFFNRLNVSGDFTMCCLQFDVPATYPTTSPEIEIPELEGKTAKMYRGGKICLTIHFKPLWAKNRCDNIVQLMRF